MGYQVPDVNDEAKKIIDTFRKSFFSGNRWVATCITFFVPIEDCLLDRRDIEKLRASTSEDFVTATPKPMPAYIKGSSVNRAQFKCVFRRHEKSYRLCKKVAVSFDGTIYRATDAEIEAALEKEKHAPSTDAATYVKAVQEIRRQQEIARALQSDSG